MSAVVFVIPGKLVPAQAGSGNHNVRKMTW